MTRRSVEELHEVLVGQVALRDITPADICRKAVDILTLTGAAISLLSAGFGPTRVGAFDAHSAELDDLQFTLGEGPGIDAATAMKLVVLEEAAAALLLWPQFAPAATNMGINGIVAIPLRIETMPLGIISFFSARIIAKETLADALIIAAFTTEILLAQQNNNEPVVRAVDEMHTAIVHQATGMISAQLECSVEEALVRLRAYSYAHNRPIRDVSTDVVQRNLRFGD